jgi:ribosomal protein S27AE
MFGKSTSDARPDTDTPAAPKPANPHHIRRDFYQLALDWHCLRQLPRPAQGAVTRKPAYRISGHSAEWASDNLARIADLFASWHDFLAEYRGETRPRRKRLGRNADGCDIWQFADAEQVRVHKAWTYLEPRIEQLCDLAPAEALTEISNLHRKIRKDLGLNKPTYTLPIPCPNEACGLKTLQRSPGADRIVCGACGYTVREEYYPLLVRIAIDTMLTDPVESQ